jgi:15-cis-phytoene synthase
MIKMQHWEHPLLDMAHQALESGVSAQDSHTLDQQMLSSAYKHCEDITRVNSKTFYMASGLLPLEKRRAIQALYAFCRVSDDIVDRPVHGTSPGETNPAAVLDSTQKLESWRSQVNNEASPSGAHPSERSVNMAWTDSRHAYGVPTGYVNQLIDGLALDLQRSRYDTFSDLAKYCYGVACTVGLMSMHITGYSTRAAIPYAVRLGVALQLTNILRDIGEDLRAGRFYLPIEELEAFGLNETYLQEGLIDNRWRAFMRFQIQRARRLYEESLPGVAYLHRDGRFAIAAAGGLYSAILNQIEANDYDVFSRRASVGTWGKLRRLPGIWLRANLGLPTSLDSPAASR